MRQHLWSLTRCYVGREYIDPGLNSHHVLAFLYPAQSITPSINGGGRTGPESKIVEADSVGKYPSIDAIKLLVEQLWPALHLAPIHHHGHYRLALSACKVLTPGLVHDLLNVCPLSF